MFSGVYKDLWLFRDEKLTVNSQMTSALVEHAISLVVRSQNCFQKAYVDKRLDEKHPITSNLRQRKSPKYD